MLMGGVVLVCCGRCALTREKRCVLTHFSW